MDLHILTVAYGLPLWFLLLSLFLPRLALFLLWIGGMPASLVGVVLWALLPRVLVLVMVYLQQGLGFWFMLHLLAAVIVWGGSGGYHARRRRRRDV